MSKRPNQIKPDEDVTGNEVIHCSDSETDNTSLSLLSQQVASLGNDDGFNGQRTIGGEIFTWVNGYLMTVISE